MHKAIAACSFATTPRRVGYGFTSRCTHTAALKLSSMPATRCPPPPTSPLRASPVLARLYLRKMLQKHTEGWAFDAQDAFLAAAEVQLVHAVRHEDEERKVRGFE